MDKRIWAYISLILAFIVIFLALIYLPAYYAKAYSEMYPEKTWNQSELNESQLSLLTDIWGANITMGEYYELIYPEYLDRMPPELRSSMYNTTMKWPKNGQKTVVSTFFRNQT